MYKTGFIHAKQNIEIEDNFERKQSSNLISLSTLK